MTPIAPARPRVRFGVTDRGTPGHRPPYDANLGVHVGDDPDVVAGHRARLLERTGAARLVFVRQVHGRAVAVAPGDAMGVLDLGTPADAIVGVTPGTAVAVLTADCLPVLFCDEDAGMVAAAHAGRPGLVAGVLPATVAAMVDSGARTDRIVARVGPAICGRCYEVPAEMRDELGPQLPGAAATTSWGTPSLDLPAAARSQLGALGVQVVGQDGRCTREDPLLFSYRRDGLTGRFASWIAVA